MLKNATYFFLFITIILLPSCEERFQPEITTADPLLVVEGHIEAGGDNALPPYVILTRTIPFYDEISPEQIDALFVHDAYVRVTQGAQSVVLEEVCWEDLPEELRDIAVETVPELEDVNVNYCLYTDLSFSLLGEIGKTYDLYIETEKETLTATTMIPELVTLDTVYFTPAPGTFGDSLLEMRIGYVDPESPDNFYRYFTSTNGEQFYPGFNSVFNDDLINGQTLDFPLAKGEPPFREEDAGIFGLYHPGDEVILRWMTIDEAHYRFWDTLEFNKVNQGPFGSYTQVKSNVEGAVGIWGGYAAGYYSVVAE